MVNMNARRIISLMIAFTLIVTMPATAFGATKIDPGDSIDHKIDMALSDDIKALQIDENTVKLYDYENSAILKIHENEGVIKYDVKVDGESESDYFLINKEKGTLYSSQTGQTVTIQELSIDQSVENQKAAKAKSNWPKTYSISYKKLRSVVSSTANKFTIAVAIITVAAAIMGVTISTAGGVVVALIGAGFVAIYEGLKYPKKTKGVKVKVDRKKVTEYHGNSSWTGYRYNVVKVWTY
ncbi:hypothetical protein [Hornefia porci]|nr:hypothetical protein [Hornefia porci]